MTPAARRRFAPGALLLLGLVLSAPPAAAGPVRVRATLEPERIGLDETATLSIQVRGGGFGRLRFRPDFELENLEVVGGPYEHEEVRMGGGRLTRSHRVSWRLRAVTTGPARVRSLSIRMADEVIRLGDRGIEVQEEPAGLSPSPAEPRSPDDPIDRVVGRWAPPWRDRPRRPAVFLRAEVRPERPVVGQQVLYTVHLYTLTDVTAVTPRRLPDFRGFWTRDVPQPSKLPTDLVDVDGRRYGRVVLLQKALFPLQAGRQELQPTEMDLLVRRVDRSFFGPSIAEPEQVHLRTDNLTVDVQPLPPAPSGFTGAVGRISLAATLEPRSARVGEAATLTVTLSGRGNLEGLPEPPPPRVAGLRFLPPEQGGDERFVGTELRGVRTWSYPVVPERAGTYELALPPMPYYDPVEERFAVAAAAPLQLTVRPPSPAAEPPPASEAGEAPAGAPSRAARLGRRLAESWQEFLPWILAAPVALALAVALARRRHASGPVVSRRSARQRLEHGLREARLDARPRQTAARIEEAWRQFLDERWGIPPGTPSVRWGDLLAGRGADPEAARQLVRLADDLHYLRYAPQLSTCEPFCGEVIERCHRLLRRLA